MSEIHQLVKNKGYWKANDKYFDVKVNAILEAQSNDSEVTFHYNDQWWDQVDWTVEPNESLEELYLKRARDLRNKYKTLILRFSGGADSMNIIKTFVDNNIKIDVIIVNEYCELLNADRFVIPSSAEKIIITMPFIRELQKQGVEFEFLEVDNSILFPMLGDNVDWIFRFNMPRFLLVEFSSPRTVLHPKLQQYNNPDTCIISGVDKPQVWCRHNKIWTFEMPDITQVLCDPGHSHIVQEPFYQSADLPELVVKQCHVVKSYMKTHADQIPVNNHNPYTTRMSEKKWLVPILYSKYYDFVPGTPLPYFNMPVPDSHRKYYPGPWGQANPPGNGPYDRSVDYGIEKMSIYNTHLQGVCLADKLIHRRFKNLDSIFDGGLDEITTKPRWLGK